MYVVYLTRLPIAKDIKTSNGITEEWWTGKNVAGRGRDRFQRNFQALAWENWGKPWITSVGIVGVPADFRTKHLSNTSFIAWTRLHSN